MSRDGLALVRRRALRYPAAGSETALGSDHFRGCDVKLRFVRLLAVFQCFRNLEAVSSFLPLDQSRLVKHLTEFSSASLSMAPVANSNFYNAVDHLGYSMML